MPRDAVIKSAGSDVVFIDNDGHARMLEVEITGHTGPNVGIRSDEIEPGQRIIVKGNERIRDGQPVRTE